MRVSSYSPTSSDEREALIEFLALSPPHGRPLKRLFELSGHSPWAVGQSPNAVALSPTKLKDS